MSTEAVNGHAPRLTPQTISNPPSCLLSRTLVSVDTKVRPSALLNCSNVPFSPTASTLALLDPTKAALDVLADLLSRGEPLRVSVQRAGLRATLEVQPVLESPGAPPPGAPETESSELTSVDDTILEVLRKADNAIKITTIASRGKLTYNGYLRGRVGHLCKAGLVEKCPDHRYQIA